MRPLHTHEWIAVVLALILGSVVFAIDWFSRAFVPVAAVGSDSVVEDVGPMPGESAEAEDMLVE